MNNNYKCIVALKLSKHTQLKTQCTITLQDRVKKLMLPSEDAQFFDIPNLNAEYLTLDFAEYGMVTVPLPPVDNEVELADAFELPNLKGKYFIMFLKANNSTFESNQKFDSPVKHYLKSIKNRTQERANKKKTKSVLETPKQSPVQKQISEVEIYKSQIDGYKGQIQLLKQQNSINFQEELLVSEAKRKELQGIFQKACQDRIEESSQLTKQLTSLNEQCSNLKQQIDQKDQQIKQLNLECDGIRGQLSHKDWEIDILHQQVTENAQIHQICQDLTLQRQNLETAILDLSVKSEEELQKLIKLQQLTKDELERQYLEHNNLQANIKQLQSELNKAQHDGLAYKTLSNQLQTKIKTLEVTNGLNQTMEQVKGQLSQQIVQKDGQIKKLNKDIELLQAQLVFKQYHENDELQDENARLKQEIVNLHETMTELQITLQLTQAQNARIPQLEKFQKSLELKVEQLQNKVNEQKQQLQNDDKQYMQSIVNKLSNQVDVQIQEIFELKQQILSMTINMQDQEKSSTKLKVMMSEMIDNGVAYHPAKNDDLDGLLGEYINQKVDKDKYIKLFKRESFGVYQYGNKKIFVKSEQGKILIRQGGGYMSIEEFLALNEREKQHDPIAGIIRKQAISKKTERMKQIS